MQMLGGEEMYNFNSSFEGAMQTAHRIMAEGERLINNFSLRLNWLEFRHIDSSFNLSLLLDFKFKRHDVEVYFQVVQLGGGPSTEKELAFKSLYKTEYNQGYIQKINYQIANRIYDFIEIKAEEIKDIPF